MKNNENEQSSKKEVQKVVKNILCSLGFSSLNVDLLTEKERCIIPITGEKRDMEYFCEKTVLQSLLHLTQHILLKKNIREKFFIDIGGTHLSHIKDLEEKALLIAERVKTFHSRAEMSPMNAYDRMIIHTLFKKDAHIKTFSEGEGKERRVVLFYSEDF
jgi:predicted RNA-binding protein Jag